MRALVSPSRVHRGPRLAGLAGLGASLLFAGWLAVSCSPRRGESPAGAPAGPPGRPEDRVLVICNGRDSGSVAIADYYCRRRGIRVDHRLVLDAAPEDEIGQADYRGRIERPVRAWLARSGLGDSIDFIVLTRGMPLRISENGCSVDACLGAMELAIEPPTRRDPVALRRLANPYYGSAARFRHAEFGTRLVSRLDGYEISDALALIDRSLEARPGRGPFLLDVDPRYEGAGYAELNAAARRAATVLRQRGLRVILEETKAFAGSDEPLAGYFSWGSNDGSFNVATYRALRFLPGAVAETAVSTSGRAFRPRETGQSLVADLIANGVTGVKGYVSEPLTMAICRVDILFDRYTAGYTLAESFAAASPLVKWKDVVVGDPLCAPYAPGTPVPAIGGSPPR